MCCLWSLNIQFCPISYHSLPYLGPDGSFENVNMILLFTENLQWILQACRNMSKTLSVPLQALHDLTDLFHLSYPSFNDFVWSHFEILTGFTPFHPSWELCLAFCPTDRHQKCWKRVEFAFKPLASSSVLLPAHTFTHFLKFHEMGQLCPPSAV